MSMGSALPLLLVALAVGLWPLGTGVAAEEGGGDLR